MNLNFQCFNLTHTLYSKCLRDSTTIMPLVVHYMPVVMSTQIKYSICSELTHDECKRCLQWYCK